MDYTFEILLFLHLVSLAVGTAANVVMPILMPQMMKSPPEARGGYATVAKTLSLYGRGAFAVLILTGIAMVWLRYGGVAGMNEWFWVKMALIVVMIVLLGAAAVLGPARLNPRFFGLAARLILLGIIASAVLAFS